MRETKIEELLAENEERLNCIRRPFNPITGEGGIGERVHVKMEGFSLEEMWLPVEMLDVPLIQKAVDGGISSIMKEMGTTEESDRLKIVEQITRIWCKYDFAFWAALYVYIANKRGGEEILFRISRPQRKLLKIFERRRKMNKPLRFILVKARQLGGSTLIQLYMAWLQLVHHYGLNSLIIAHQGIASDEIKAMFDRMIQKYPTRMLYELGECYRENEPKMASVGKSGGIFKIPQRGFNVKLGTAERPDSCRGGSYSLVHLSEVGLWKKTEGKTPEDIVRSACSGVLYEPNTMIVYESTANGTDNFFHREYYAAKKGRSQFEAIFIAWYDIDQYSLEFESAQKRREFAEWLLSVKDVKETDNNREESGAYLWWLWKEGATLEAINWYIMQRKSVSDHGLMAAEFPSDDIEAFVASGERVFDMYAVNDFRDGCKAPKWKGALCAAGNANKKALKDIHFVEDRMGCLSIWERPEILTDIRVLHRYLCVVDIGGRGRKADWSVISVFDRLNMMEGGKPSVVAQWYGHTDMDLLAWKSAQIAAYYDNALLVIESNTLETHDRERQVDGDQSHYILNQIADVYDNLYARKQSEEDIIQGAPRKYGFHTNTRTKPMIIAELIRSVREKAYIERDEKCLDEFLTYEKKPNGSYGAVSGAHDDLLMTRAIGLHICFNEMPLPKIVEKTMKKTILKRLVSAASF